MEVTLLALQPKSSVWWMSPLNSLPKHLRKGPQTSSGSSAISSDDKIFEVDDSVAKQFLTIKHMIKEPYIGSALCSSQMFRAKSLRRSSNNPIRLVACCMLLEYKWFLSLVCKSLVDKISRDDLEHIHKLFNIQPDFTPAEKAKIRRESPWTFNNN
ncbi:hypothetical protein M9H77_17617 [Catharanthus roseus]|uniref:Uncharacterized protein n=1 Tax=Catharanthus roseus TaxID=4058 RepID=A0ACC0B558_CATRO|nr:hypothetical protein M9H77_17617 [Catharanthus roseus]